MIDLHTHSRASDGSDSPTELVALANRLGLSAIALTDHDTLEGLAEARQAAEAGGIRLIPGCELSCEVDEGTMHLLVYFLDDCPGPLQDRLAGLQAARATRNERIVELLAGAGVEITLDELLVEAGSGSVGRPHFAAILVRKGYVSTIQGAFDVWLAKGRPAYLGRDRLAPSEAIELAHASGALAVLAHPGTLGLAPSALESFVAGLAEAGLDGLESDYASYSPEERQTYRNLARRHGLTVTGGSDYHGTYKPGISLGTGRGDLAVAGDLLDRLVARRPAARQF